MNLNANFWALSYDQLLLRSKNKLPSKKLDAHIITGSRVKMTLRILARLSNHEGVGSKNVTFSFKIY